MPSGPNIRPARKSGSDWPATRAIRMPCRVEQVSYSHASPGW